jgi:hypothetical protein
MSDIRPCPYCGGEVEVVRLNRKKEKDEPVYRISCRRCKALVARGTKFEKETDEEGRERIKQYEDEIAKRMSPIHAGTWRQSEAAKQRDRMAKHPSRYERE